MRHLKASLEDGGGGGVAFSALGSSGEFRKQARGMFETYLKRVFFFPLEISCSVPFLSKTTLGVPWLSPAGRKEDLQLPGIP